LLENGTNATKSRLNISFNKAFLNSTNLSSLNTSAIITLYDISYSDPKPVVDYEDDGTYEDCPASQCTELSYVGGTYVFNTTHFTGYSSAETGAAITSCPVTINESTTLTQNLWADGDCITINNSDVVLECSGFSINGSGTGVGINATSLNNIIIRNCFIENFTTNIYAEAVNNSQFINNTARNSSEYSFWADSSINNTFANNTIRTAFSTAFMFTTYQAGGNIENNTVQNNIAECEGIECSGFGIYFDAESVNTQFINNTGASNGATGIYFHGTGGTVINNTGISTGTDINNPGMVLRSTYGTHIDNTGMSAESDGIRIYLGSYSNYTNNLGTTNRTDDNFNGMGGIAVDQSTEIRLVRNKGTSTGNTSGILVWRSSDNLIQGNNGTSIDGSGIRHRGGSNNQYLNNTGTSTGGNGMTFEAGSFLIEAYNGEWHEAGVLHLVGRPAPGYRYSTSTIAVPEGTTKVRITQAGTDTAHLDAVLLDSNAPTAVKDLSDNSSQPNAKLALADYDVINAASRTIEIEWALPGASLAISGIEEDLLIAPMTWPGEGKTLSYTLGAPQLFTMEWSPFSKHPDGTVYAKFSTTPSALLLYLDMTPDNTLDYGGDWAELRVEMPEGFRNFRMSHTQTQWGRSEYTYTDKAAWQHKTYNFTIPFAELGAGIGGTIRFRMGYYGTGGAQPCSGETIINNTGTSTTGRGILVDTCTYTTLLWNNGTSNSNSGIEITMGSENNLTESNGTSTSGTGILLSTTSINTLLQNIGRSTSGAGIMISSGTNNTLQYCNATSTSGYGIRLVSSADNNMTSSNARSASSAALSIIESDNNIISNNTFASDTGFAVFIEGGKIGLTLFSDGFEDETLAPFNTYGNAGWTANDSAAYTGSYSAMSGNITDDESSVLNISLTISEDATLSFARKISSEESADYLTFYIDDISQGQWSGEYDWEVFSYSLSAGPHNLTWNYSKDSSGEAGVDAAWIDDVNITTGENISQYNVFNGTTLFTNNTWIFIGENSSSNTFERTLFSGANGTIQVLPPVIAQNNTNTTIQKLNITYNKAFMNSTNLSFLNTSAIITLYDISYSDPKPVVDYEDDGTYEDCPAGQCTELSYLGGAYVFNTTHFTSYSTQESGVEITGCPVTINQSTTLTQYLESNTSCIEIGNSSMTLDCSGFSIRFNGGGNDLDYGIRAENRTNITITNCNVLDINSTGRWVSGIVLNNVTNSTIIYSTAESNCSNNNTVVKITNSSNTNITRNTIASRCISGESIGILSNNSLYTSFSHNTIISNGTTKNYGIRIIGNNNTATHNNVTMNGSLLQHGVNVDKGLYNTVAGNNVVVNWPCSTSECILLTGANFTHIENNTITINVSGGGYGVDAYATNNNTFLTNNIIVISTFVSYGIRAGINNTINGNTIYLNLTSNTIYGIDANHQNTINNNTISVFTSDSDGYAFGIYAGNGITARNNNIRTYGGRDIYGIYVLGNSSADSNTINLTAFAAGPMWGINTGGQSNVTNNNITVAGTDYLIGINTGALQYVENNTVNVLSGTYECYGIDIGANSVARKNNVTMTVGGDWGAYGIFAGNSGISEYNTIFVNSSGNTVTGIDPGNYYSASYNNITVSGTYDVYGLPVYNWVNVTNNRIRLIANETGNAGVYASGNTWNSTIASNVIIATGNQTRGIALVTAGAPIANITVNYNSIEANGTLSHGIYTSNAVNSTFVGNNITSSNEYGIWVELGEFNRFENTTLIDPANWIFVSNKSQSNNNFTRTRFAMPNGSIHVLPMVMIENYTNITKAKLNISLNKAYLNSTNLSSLNTSAEITLNNIVFTNPRPVVDYNNDGVYEDCPPSQCAELGYAGGTFAFNTTHFTGYSSEETTGATCPYTFTESTVLGADIHCNETAVILNGSNITLDCNGHGIYYAEGGRNQAYGIFAYVASNLTVKNCGIMSVNSTLNYSIAINVTNVTNFIIANNTIVTNGSRGCHGFYASDIENVTVANNTVTVGRIDYGYGMLFQYGRRNRGLIDNNNLTSTGSYSNGIAVGNNFTVNNNRIRVTTISGTAITANHENLIENNTVNVSGLNVNSGILCTDRCVVRNNLAYVNGTSDNIGINLNSFTLAANNSAIVWGTGYCIGISANSNNTIENNTAQLITSDSDNKGIWIYKNNTIRNNNVTMNGTDSNEGIRDGAGNQTIIGNRIIMSTVTNNNAGIYAYPGTILQYNTFIVNGTEDTNTGLDISYNDNFPQVAGNNVSVSGTNTITGIYMTGQTNATLAGNKVAVTATSANNYAINIDGSVANSTVANNTITASGADQTYGILIRNSLTGANNITGNSINVTEGGFDSAALALITDVMGQNIVNNRIDINASSGHSILLNDAAYNSLTGNNLSSSNGYGVFVTDGGNNSFENTTLSNPESWLFVAAGSNGNNFTRTLFVQPDGSILTLPTVLLENDTNVTKANLEITTIFAFLNSTNLSSLNTSSIITFEGVSMADPRPIVDYEDDSSYITCPASQCTELSYTGTTYVFNTTRFTGYTLEETPGVQYNFTNISVVKTDYPDPVNASDYLNYTITVNSTGNGTAYNVVVNDTYPLQVIYQSALPAPEAGTNNTWQLGIMPNGTAIQINITVLVQNVSNGTVINNTANVSIQNETLAVLRFSDTESTIVLNPPVYNYSNMTIRKLDSPDPVNASQNLTYQINVSSTGNGTAYNVTVNDTYPEQVVYLTSMPAPIAGRNNTWLLGNLTAGTNISINITVLVLNITNGTIINNTANVSFQNETGVVLVYGNFAETLVLNPPLFNVSNLSIAKTDSPDPVAPGAQLTYTITVTSTGNGTAYNVTVNDTYPEQVVYVSSMPAPIAGTNNSWEIGNLTPGIVVLLNITVNVDPLTANGTVINNTANLTFQNETSALFTGSANASTTVSNATPTPTPSPTQGGGTNNYPGTLIIPKREPTVTGPCIESWQCEDWGRCINGRQERVCVDANNCGTTDMMPAREQNCEMPVTIIPEEEIPLEPEPVEPELESPVELPKEEPKARISLIDTIINLFKASLWPIVFVLIGLLLLAVVYAFTRTREDKQEFRAPEPKVQEMPEPEPEETPAEEPAFVLPKQEEPKPKYSKKAEFSMIDKRLAEMDKTLKKLEKTSRHLAKRVRGKK
jgi:uncharacterized repeat protein (TIGR01451 family)